MDNKDNTETVLNTMCDHFGDIAYRANDSANDIKQLVLQTIIWARANTKEFPIDQMKEATAKYGL
jgi:hypothetical protein